jgi:ribosomal protein S18 acetylase RimI-like enzyme
MTATFDELELRTIDASMCLPLRQAVLWPQATLAEVALSDDAEGLHIGGFVGDALCCVASCFVTGASEARLCKFATDPAWQGRGIGSAVLREGARQLAADGIESLWFDARERAQAFYRHRGFIASGPPFYKGDVRYVRMHGPLSGLHVG